MPIEMLQILLKKNFLSITRVSLQKKHFRNNTLDGTKIAKHVIWIVTHQFLSVTANQKNNGVNKNWGYCQKSMSSHYKILFNPDKKDQCWWYSGSGKCK